MPLRGLADAVNVTDGASARAHLSAPIAAALLAREGIEPILQLTCRDRNRIALQADLMGAAASGVHNLLCSPATIPRPATSPRPSRCSTSIRPTLDRGWRATCATRASFRPDARSRARRSFFLGAADAPIDPPPGWKPDKLAAKIAAGAHSRRPSSAWMPGIVRRYAARLAEHEATRDFFLLIGIAPLRSAKSARWMKENLFGTIIPDAFVERLEQAADPAAEGQRIAIELIEELATIPGVAGVHVMAPANEAAVPRGDRGGAPAAAEARRAG